MPVSIKTSAQLSPPVPLVITTTSLPGGMVGNPYNATLTATGGVSPYSWSATGTPSWMTVSAGGVITGTPTATGSVTLGVTVRDSVSTTTGPNNLSFTVVAASSVQAPSAMFQGYLDSHSICFCWWPPGTIVNGQYTAGTVTPDYYHIYRNGTMIYGDGVGTAPNPGGAVYQTPSGAGNASHLLFTDGTAASGPSTALTANTTYTYTVRSVFGGAESADGPALTVTTLNANNTPPTAPTPPTDPATYGATTAPVLPTGGTTWLATNVSASSIAGTGTNNATNCSYSYAVANAKLGDVIVLTAGQTYTALTGSMPAWTQGPGNSNQLWIVSSQAPPYNPSGTLPAWSYSAVRPDYTPLTLSAAPVAGATTGTLTANFTGKTGYYYCRFYEAQPAIYTGFIDNGAGGGTYTGVAGTVLTVTSVTQGRVSIGQFLSNSVVVNPYINSYGTGTGGTGTYNLQFFGAGQAIPSQTWTVPSTPPDGMEDRMVWLTNGSTAVSWAQISTTASLSTTVSGSPPAGNSFAGTLTVTPITGGPIISVGMMVWGAGVPAGCQIVGIGSVANTYWVSAAATVASTTMTIGPQCGGPLALGCKAQFLAGVGNWVTPADANAMACIQYDYTSGGSGFGMYFPHGTGNCRTIGLWILPRSGYMPSGSYLTGIATDNENYNTPVITAPVQNLTVDRCMIGNDSTYNIATFTGSVSGTTLTVTAVANGTIQLGGIGPTYDIFPYWTQITANGTGTGGTGTYTISNSLTVGSSSLVASAYVNMRHGIFGWYNNLIVHQTNFLDMHAGPMTPLGGGENESHGVLGYCGPWCIQNCYMSVVSINQFCGGGWFSPNNQPHDHTFRYNLSVKPSWWRNPNLGFGNWNKNHFETKTIDRAFCHDNVFQACWNGYGGAQKGKALSSTARCTNAGVSWTTTTPWAHVYDVDFQNNVIYAVGQGWLPSTDDGYATSHAARMRFKNNLVWIEPGIGGATSDASNAMGLAPNGPCSDVIIDHNTFIIDPTHCSQSWYAYTWYGGPGWYNSQGANAVIVPNLWTTVMDRWQITNNILDAGAMHNGYSGVEGPPILSPTTNPTFSNLTWNANLMPADGHTTAAWNAAAPPGTQTYSTSTPNVGLGYGAIGFAVAMVNTTQPVHPSDWNITSGTYSTLATDGTAIGAHF